MQTITGSYVPLKQLFNHYTIPCSNETILKAKAFKYQEEWLCYALYCLNPRHLKATYCSYISFVYLSGWRATQSSNTKVLKATCLQNKQNSECFKGIRRLLSNVEFLFLYRRRRVNHKNDNFESKSFQNIQEHCCNT